MTAVAIALLTLVLAGKDQGRRMADHCRAGLPVCAAVLLASCDNKPAKEKAKPDRSALAAGGAAFIVRVDPVEGTEVHAGDLSKAAEIIENRLNSPRGIRAVIVTPTGGNKLMVEAADLTVAEAEAAKPLLQKSARLEFRLLGPTGREETTEEDASIKPGYVKMRCLDEDREGKKKIEALTPAERRARPKPNKCLWVKNKAEISGKIVEGAWAQLLPGNADYHISVELHEKYDDKMIEVTKANIGKPMAIIVDGEILSAPTIQTAFGRQFQITGSFTEAEAMELSSQLMNPLENPLVVEKITAIPPATAGKK